MREYSENFIELEIKGLIKAEDYCQEELESGQAFKIMTGDELAGIDSNPGRGQMRFCSTRTIIINNNSYKF